jgi:hypothetical protein
MPLDMERVMPMLADVVAGVPTRKGGVMFVVFPGLPSPEPPYDPGTDNR